jgi:hypothetical protein
VIWNNSAKNVKEEERRGEKKGDAKSSLRGFRAGGERQGEPSPCGYIPVYIHVSRI